MHTLLRSILVLVVAAAAGGCTFGRFPSEVREPTLAALPPCFAGDVCGGGLGDGGFVWLRDTVMAARSLQNQ